MTQHDWLWRYPIYLLAFVAALIDCFWLSQLAAPMGWGGRTDTQILLFATLFDVVPSVASLFFAFRAVEAAHERLLKRAAVSVIVALAAVPLAWVVAWLAYTSKVLPF